MFKNLNKIFFVDAAACAAVLVGFILAIVSNTFPGFAFANAGIVFALGAIGLVAFAAAAFCDVKFGAQNLITAAVKLVAIVCISVAFALIANARINDAGQLFTWDTQNVTGLNAFYTGVVALVAFFIGIVLNIVTSFLQEKKA